MVLNHVAQRPGLFIVTAATFDAEPFGVGDLNVVDVLPVPERLEDAVRKTKDEQVLHRLFSEIMIDAKDLLLFKNFCELLVESARAFEVMAERFLDDDARPALVSGLRELGLAKVTGNQAEIVRRCSQIEQVVAARVAFIVDLVELAL